MIRESMRSFVALDWVIICIVKTCLCEIPTEPPVELRWDFTSCSQAGRFGPDQTACDAAYKGTNLEGDVIVDQGIQVWTVPSTGLYLVTARAPSGAADATRQPGRGADLTGEFHMTKGQKIRILVGQQGTASPADKFRTERPLGGSGGTFVVRESDGFILMVAGGGSSGAGNKWNDRSKLADATIKSRGNNGSLISNNHGQGGTEGQGGQQGVMLENDISAPGGGAGYKSDGEKVTLRKEAFSKVQSLKQATAFLAEGFTVKGPGVGGYFSVTKDEISIKSSGGFGGGGAGTEGSGCGGGGGYSGGGGGPSNGWGGGGGSLNNGDRQKNYISNRGEGAVIISFIGDQCCGPVVVYIAMTFVAGVLATVVIGYIILRILRSLNTFDENGQNTCGRCWAKLSLDPKREDSTPIKRK